MAASPQFKIYDNDRIYQAACKEPEAAAALVSFYGMGATIRWEHTSIVLWAEGADGYASESYDAVADKCQERMDNHRAAVRAKHEAQVQRRS